MGNGGSAAIVSHVHNDLCKAVGVRAVVFDDTPLLTALANDEGYHEVFRRPLELWADRGDLLIAVSSSGESENIVSAAASAKQKGCTLLTFTGFKPTNRLRQIGDFNIYVPAAHYGYVEIAH
jgi:D-sedoheptulose 7-phosphate isomerase